MFVAAELAVDCELAVVLELAVVGLDGGLDEGFDLGRELVLRADREDTLLGIVDVITKM